MVGHPASAQKPLLDYSAQELTGANGISYASFRKSLPRPRYAVLWSQLLAAYTMLALLILLSARLSFNGPLIKAASVAAFGAAFGYVLAFIYLFLHEVAHYGLATSRRINDRLGSVLIASWFGTSVDRYRAAHWKHHEDLGKPTDPENSYFLKPSPAFLLGRLFWGGTLATLLSKARYARFRLDAAKGGRAVPAAFLGGVALHLAILASLAAAGKYITLAAWIVGVTAFFPFFASVRQMLEHRSLTADPAADYFRVEHGAGSRIFEDGPFASTFGAAGFNRHLIHHWDPALSCTNLKKVEEFLLTSKASEAVLRSRTTYFKTFAQLFFHG